MSVRYFSKTTRSNTQMRNPFTTIFASTETKAAKARIANLEHQIDLQRALVNDAEDTYTCWSQWLANVTRWNEAEMITGAQSLCNAAHDWFLACVNILDDMIDLCDILKADLNK